MKKLIAILALTVFVFHYASSQPSTSQLIRIYSDSLVHATTPKDSMRFMYNLFDLDSKNRKENANKLFELVSRHGDKKSQLDMIRQTANLNFADTPYIKNLLKSLKDFSDGPGVMETRLFLRLSLVENPYSKTKWEEGVTGAQVSRRMANYFSNPPANPEDRVVELYKLVIELAGTSRGPLLATYVDSLQNLVESMNLPTGAVRNYIYNRSSILFSAAHDPEHTVITEKKLLNIIDSLQRAYANDGRPYRTLPVNRYISYRRLLQNASALNEAELEQYYDEVKQLAKTDSAVSQDIAHNRLVDIYYLMAKKEYAKALPLLRAQLGQHDRVSVQQSKLIEMLYEAASGTGNREIMRESAEFLYPIKLKELKERDKFRLNDLRILYMADSIRAVDAVKSNIDKEREETQMKTHTVIVIICIVALLFLAIFILFLARQRSRILSMAESLKSTNEKLIKERNDLRQSQADLIEARDASKAADRLKTDFINNMSHEIKTPLSAITEYSQLIVDCIPDEKRQYLDRFASIININSRLILTLVNDVLDVASLERKEMSITKEPVYADNICEIALGNVFEGGKTPANSPVKLLYTPSSPDTPIITDPARVAQVLTNLLSNARKFTEKGTIELSYATDPEAKTITFMVADTGIGIPRGMEEEIFSRFRQLDHTVQGTGLGLYISRLLADLLGGTVKVDTTYRGGACFLFTIPTGM